MGHTSIDEWMGFKAMVIVTGEVPLGRATKAILEMEEVLRKYGGKVNVSKYRPKVDGTRGTYGPLHRRI